jgi:phospholipid-binding lipoprotein MlaA
VEDEALALREFGRGVGDAATPRRTRKSGGPCALVSRRSVCEQDLAPPAEVSLRLGLVIAAAGASVSLLAGVAQADPPPSRATAAPGDPFERMNRRFYAGHITFDRRFFLPLARLYRALTPGVIGEGIHDVVQNLSEPVVIANDILQARFRQAGRDMARLTTNSSVGILGLFDVAKDIDLPHHDTDFGITLGVWGVHPGPYLFVPILGPSTVRDAFGHGVDIFLNPMLYVRFPGHQTLEITAPIVSGLDTRYRAEGELEAVTSEAADPYATLRSLYLQSREAEVRGANALPELPPLDEEPPASPSPADSQTPAPPASHAPPTSDPPAAAPGLAPSAAADPAAAQLADAWTDPNAPIVTARRCDLGGVAFAAHGA